MVDVWRKEEKKKKRKAKKNKAEEEQKMWVELFRTAFVAQPNKQQSAMENRATTTTHYRQVR